MSEHKNINVKNVILVAPWLDPFRENTTDFFEFEIDADLAKRTKSLIVFDSDNDSDGVHTSIELIREKINKVTYKQFYNYGHFTLNGMGTVEFPELLEAVLAN